MVLAIRPFRRITAKAFRAAAVVLQKQDQRVVELPLPLDLGHDAADPLIHVVDHRRVDFHVAALPRLVFHLLPVVRLRRKLGRRIDQAGRFEPLQSLGANRREPLVVFSLVLGDVFRQGVHRPMCRRVSDVQKERLLGRLLGMFAEKRDRVVADRVGVVIRLRLVLRIVHRRDERIAPTQRRRVVETARAGDRAVELGKSPLHRPVVLRAFRASKPRHVPLARHVRPVAGRLERFGNRHHVAPQFALVARQVPVARHQPDTRLMLIHPRQQRSPRRAAAGRIVELRKPQSPPSQPIQIRSVDLPAITADVREAHVVRHDQDDVGRGFFFFCRSAVGRRS